MGEKIEKRVCGLVAMVLGVEGGRVLPTSSRDDVENWDSTAMVNLMFAIEEEFTEVAEAALAHEAES